jgi:hypothetical protein
MLKHHMCYLDEDCVLCSFEAFGECDVQLGGSLLVGSLYTVSIYTGPHLQYM